MNNAFLLEFIKCLESLPALWNNKSDEYKNKNLRNKSWHKLLKKHQEYYKEADMEMVKKKVNSLRATYRRELTKIKRSEKSGARGDDLYKPRLWYFEDLSFLHHQPKTKKRKRYDSHHEVLEKPVQHNANYKNQRDDADVFAEGWAVIFRQLSREQQIFAKRGIDELLMQGQLEMLTYSSVPNGLANHDNFLVDDVRKQASPN